MGLSGLYAASFSGILYAIMKDACGVGASGAFSRVGFGLWKKAYHATIPMNPAAARPPVAMPAMTPGDIGWVVVATGLPGLVVSCEERLLRSKVLLMVLTYTTSKPFCAMKVAEMLQT